MARRLGGTGRVWVHDEAGEAHSFDPGDSVPKWAAAQITNPKAWDDSDVDADTSADSATAAPTDTGDGTTQAKTDPDKDAPSETDDVKPYTKWKKPDLEAEVARRNEGRDPDDQIEVEGKGTVADLAAALEGDDAAQSDA